MFVRWKKRPFTVDFYHQEGIIYSAYLVESKRVNGKPRQKNLGYLGSIRKNERYTVKWFHQSTGSWYSDEDNEKAFVAFCTELPTSRATR